MADETEITLVHEKSGRAGYVTIRLKCGEEILFADELRPNKYEDRARVIQRIQELGIAVTAADLDKQLLRIGEEQSNDGKAEVQGDEIDIARVIRPEAFFAEEVAGLTVDIPVASTQGQRYIPSTYLQWAHGKREKVTLERTLRCGDGTELLVSPLPGELQVDAPPQWSALGRRAWLVGAEAPAPAELFKWMLERIAFFLDFPAEIAQGVTATLALWTFLTYIYPLWRAVPYLRFGGPLESGKTTAFGVLEQMVFRPIMASSMTGPALFRTVHHRGGTLLLDEAESLRSDNPETIALRSMLLAGYKRGGRASRLEPVGDIYKMRQFDVYCPKALACIAGVPPALSSRCIQIPMFRASQDSAKPRHRIDDEPHRWQDIRDGLHATVLEHGRSLRSLPQREDVCPALNSRPYELWQPLLSLAGWFQEHGALGLLPLMQHHALHCVEATRDDSIPDAEEVLLRFLADQLRLGERPRAIDLLRIAAEQEPMVFRSWSPGGVAMVFKRYGIQVHRSHGRKVYREEALLQLMRVQNSYGIDLGFTTEPLVQHGGGAAGSALSTPPDPQVERVELRGPTGVDGVGFTGPAGGKHAQDI